MKNSARFETIALTVVGAVIIWWITKGGAPAVNNLVSGGGNAPAPLNYNVPQSATWSPSMMPQPAVNINIGNQGLNYLDQKVMPMFGFVGMAQGANYGSAS